MCAIVFSSINTWAFGKYKLCVLILEKDIIMCKTTHQSGKHEDAEVKRTERTYTIETVIVQLIILFCRYKNCFLEMIGSYTCNTSAIWLPK